MHTKLESLLYIYIYIYIRICSCSRNDYAIQSKKTAMTFRITLWALKPAKK